MNIFNEKTHQKYADMFAKCLGTDRTLNAIIEKVTHNAAERELSAGYNGAHHDGGARDEANKLLAFLDGINYAKTGKTNVYAEIIRIYKMEQDSEYKKYQELKAKFGEK